MTDLKRQELVKEMEKELYREYELMDLLQFSNQVQNYSEILFKMHAIWKVL